MSETAARNPTWNPEGVIPSGEDKVVSAKADGKRPVRPLAPRPSSGAVNEAGVSVRKQSKSRNGTSCYVLLRRYEDLFQLRLCHLQGKEDEVR